MKKQIYRVTVRGPVPTDINARISLLHAAAVLQAKTQSTSTGFKDSVPEDTMPSL
jgi:hypothetical protein